MYKYQNVKAKEEGNMMYSFLFESDTPEAHYYRWRTYGTYAYYLAGGCTS